MAKRKTFCKHRWQVTDTGYADSGGMYEVRQCNKCTIKMRREKYNANKSETKKFFGEDKPAWLWGKWQKLQ